MSIGILAIKQEGATMKKAALLLAFVFVLASLAGCGKKESTDSQAKTEDAGEDKGIYRTLDEIKESGKLIVGVFSDKNPFGYVDENGDYQGYDVYFAERMAEDLGVELECVHRTGQPGRISGIRESGRDTC